MTEAEWMACSDPQAMLDLLRDGGCRRKLRLFAVGCCRRHEHMLVPEALAALRIAERFADGQVGQDERRAAREQAFHAPWHPDDAFRHRRGTAKACVTFALARQAFEAATFAGRAGRHIGVQSKRDWPPEAYVLTDRGRVLTDRSIGEAEQNALQVAVIRDVFGNPFARPVADAGCLTAAITSLAAMIYERQSFDRMPELADVLASAGCENRELIDHCLGPGPHVRGCWAVDLILGRT